MKARSLRNQFELILNYTQSLARELERLPENKDELATLVADLSPRERAELDEYLGKLAIFLMHVREDFIGLRRGLKG